MLFREEKEEKPPINCSKAASCRDYAVKSSNKPVFRI